MGHADWTEKDKTPEELRGYMYGVEYGYHLGHDLDGTRVYASIADIYESGSANYPNQENWPQDGIVEVEIKFIRHIPADKCWEAKESEV